MSDRRSTRRAARRSTEHAHSKNEARNRLLPRNVVHSDDLLPEFAGSSFLIKYVLVQLDVPRKYHEEFQARMQPLIELMYQYKKWELVFAAYPITGEVSQFVHIWKIPDESTLVEVMRQGALEPKLPPPNSVAATKLIDYNFRLAYQQVQDLVTKTKHTLLTSLSYDPENIGHQTQTILIDSDGRPYLIYHQELSRGQHKLTKLTKQLEEIRVRNDVRKRTTNINPKADPATSGEERIIAIQQLLNRGITDATLRHESAADLLFNLAGLRPTTIFEDLAQITPVKPKRQANRQAPPAASGLNFPRDVGTVLLAMPDGNVYEGNEEAFRSVAKPIPPSKLLRTQQLVKLFVDGEIPLASIPNERYEIVGDGCACYVINLSSFDLKKS